MCKNQCLDSIEESETEFTQSLEKTALPVEPESELDKSIDKLAAIAIEKFNKQCGEIKIKN